MDQIRLYWKNATAEAVGESTASPTRNSRDRPRIKELTKQMTDDRKAGKLKYRDLPYDEEMVDAVHREVEHFRDRCEVLIVLGIGGSALGNIALQNALNPVHLQPDERPHPHRARRCSCWTTSIRIRSSRWSN